MDINWFPGHMAKTLREMKQFIRQVDTIVEICDARVPESSRNPKLEELIGSKKHLLVLGKADLADPKITQQWLTYYRSHNLQALALDCLHPKQVQKLRQTILKLNEEAIAKAKAQGRLKRPIKVLVAGIPNTGKSTLINSLAGRKMAKTADRPGITRSLSWIRVGQQLELLDSPGVLWPKLGSADSQLNLAATGAIKDQLLPLHEVAAKLFEKLLDTYPEATQDRFKISAEDRNQPLEALLALSAQKRGCLLPGGVADQERWSVLLLDELRAGKIGRISLEQPSAGPATEDG